MSMTNDAIFWHQAYEDAHHEVRETVDSAYKEVRRIFKRDGGQVANDDRAEELVAALMRYWVESGNEKS